MVKMVSAVRQRYGGRQVERNEVFEACPADVPGLVTMRWADVAVDEAEKPTDGEVRDRDNKYSGRELTPEPTPALLKPKNTLHLPKRKGTYKRRDMTAK